MHKKTELWSNVSSTCRNTKSSAVVLEDMVLGLEAPRGPEKGLGLGLVSKVLGLGLGLDKIVLALVLVLKKGLVDSTDKKYINYDLLIILANHQLCTYWAYASPSRRY
jgi:hypothetical protein